MTPEDFGMFVRHLMPEAVIGEDNDGQLVVYTNRYIDPTDNMVKVFTEGEPAH